MCYVQVSVTGVQFHKQEERRRGRPHCSSRFVLDVTETFSYIVVAQTLPIGEESPTHRQRIPHIVRHGTVSASTVV
jgi:hypothetical protein